MFESGCLDWMRHPRFFDAFQYEVNLPPFWRLDNQFVNCHKSSILSILRIIYLSFVHERLNQKRRKIHLWLLIHSTVINTGMKTSVNLVVGMNTNPHRRHFPQTWLVECPNMFLFELSVKRQRQLFAICKQKAQCIVALWLVNWILASDPTALVFVECAPGQCFWQSRRVAD